MTRIPLRLTPFLGIAALTACAGTGSPATIPVRAAAIPATTTHKALPRMALYVTSSSPYFVAAYGLPLRSDTSPELTIQGPNEPVPVVVDRSHVYVGSYDDGNIYQYGLGAPGSQLSQVVLGSVASDLSGLTADRHTLFAAGRDAAGGKVLSFALPLSAGQQPATVLAGLPADFIAVATRDRRLYVGTASDGVVRVYRLPLRSGAQPLQTIATGAQNNGSIGLALDEQSRHLYVSNWSAGTVAAYALPYVANESPVRVDVRSQTYGDVPAGIAVEGSRLYVAAGGDVLSYRLPLRAHSHPDAQVPFTNGNAAGVAAAK